MTARTQVRCDACEANLTSDPSKSRSSRLVLSREDIHSQRAGLEIISYWLDETKHFCGPGCLRAWLEANS